MTLTICECKKPQRWRSTSALKSRQRFFFEYRWKVGSAFFSNSLYRKQRRLCLSPPPLTDCLSACIPAWLTDGCISTAVIHSNLMMAAFLAGQNKFRVQPGTKLYSQKCVPLVKLPRYKEMWKLKSAASCSWHRRLLVTLWGQLIIILNLIIIN